MFDIVLLSIIAPAFVASLLVAATHVPLGLEVLKRGIIFIDLATAQIAGLGAVIATIYVGESHTLGDTIIVMSFAFGAALIAGLAFSWVEKHLPEYEEALIGCTFVLAAAMALLVLANEPQGDEQIKDLLAGQILWTDWSQIGLITAIYIPILFIWFIFRDKIKSIGFYLIFSIAITTSVQVVGVYLVFASLIFPALGTWAMPKEKRLPIAYGLSIFGIIAGLLFSVITDYPTGPTLVWALAISALLVAIIGNKLKNKT